MNSAIVVLALLIVANLVWLVHNTGYKKKLDNDCPIVKEFKFDLSKNVADLTLVLDHPTLARAEKRGFLLKLSGNFGNYVPMHVIESRGGGTHMFAMCLDGKTILIADTKTKLLECADRLTGKSLSEPNRNLHQLLARIDFWQSGWLAVAPRAKTPERKCSPLGEDWRCEMKCTRRV